MSKLKDAYIISTCLAALSNMSPHLLHLHPYAAERVMVLFKMISKRYLRYVAAVEDPSTAKDQVDANQVTTYADLVRIVLEVLNSAITNTLPRNVHLLYAVLYHQQLFVPLRNHRRFADLIENIDLVLHFFNQRIEKPREENATVDQLKQVLSAAMPGWKADHLRKFPELSFKYEEQANPDAFFTPYIWWLVRQGAGDNIVLEEVLDRNFGLDEYSDDASGYESDDEDAVPGATDARAVSQA